MGCSSCSNSDGGKPAGCRSNGSCSCGASSGKLPVFDWLSNMELPGGSKGFDGVEVRFKNDRKIFFRNLEDISLVAGDIVVTESSPGYDVGIVSSVGELARMQMGRKSPNTKTHELRKILRKASQEDVKKWIEAREREDETMHKSRELAAKHNLSMKICDVEFQGDGNKAIFYYTAEDRVDFRELIRSMADAFKIRIEMKQIGARQEAGKLGGIGSCGRELCCSTWLTDFRSVSTSAARYQQLSLNPQKLAGQCGKLKCCLNFELDQYLEAFREFPDADTKLETAKGRARHQKTDIFKRLMWFSYEDPTLGGTHIPLNVERVKEIIDMNKKGKKPEDLKQFIEAIEVEREPDYNNVVGQDSLTRFDQEFKRKKKKKRKGNNKGGQQQGGPRNQNQQNKQGSKPNKPNANKGQGGGKKSGQGNNKKRQGNRPPKGKGPKPSGQKPQN